MRKVFIYIVLGLMLSDNTSLDQLFKVTFLFQHYYEHQQRDHSLSLIGFLEMYYWGHDLPDHDDEQDAQLPFKESMINLHVDFFNPLMQFRLIPPAVHHSPVYGLPCSYELPEGYLHTLLRPPKIHLSA